MGELENAAEWLDRLTKDRTEPGRVTIRSVNEPAAKPRYQTCRMETVIEAPGFGPVDQELEYTLRREYWPSPGDVLRALVHIERPERTEIDWDAYAQQRAKRS